MKRLSFAMKFEVRRAGLNERVKIVDAASHLHAAAAFFKCSTEAVERISGWGGQDGTFHWPAVGARVIVKRIA